MAPDRQVVAARLAVIEEALSFLGEMAALDEASFAGDRRNVRATERYLQLASEALFDIGSHLIASLRLERPARFGDIVPALARGGILSPETAAALGDLAGFRNLLVHDYDRVAPTRLHAFCQTRLGDFRAFVREVAVFIGRGDVGGA